MKAEVEAKTERDRPKVFLNLNLILSLFPARAA
jgi:hypothetical protein